MPTYGERIVRKITTSLCEAPLTQQERLARLLEIQREINSAIRDIESGIKV